MDEITTALIFGLYSLYLNLFSLALHLIDTRKKKRRRRWWTKPMLLDRNTEGTLNILLSKSVKDGFCFEEFMRVDQEMFNYLLSEIEQEISCKTTNMRDPVQPCVKLAVTLRYLATGTLL
jgi:hypothetical protein